MGIFFSQTKNVNENEEQNKIEEQNVSICEEDIDKKMDSQNIVEEVLKKDIDNIVEEITLPAFQEKIIITCIKGKLAKKVSFSNVSSICLSLEFFISVISL